MDYKKMNAEQFDIEIGRNTGFKDMDDLLQAKGNYRPSCDVNDPFGLELANRYDLEMRRQDLAKRAYRYGEMTAVEQAIKSDNRIKAREANNIRRLLAGRH